MKHLLKLALGAVIAVAAPFAAHATPINGTVGFGGNGSYNATTGTFTAGGPVTGIGANGYVNAAGTGDLSMFTMFNPATFSTFVTGTTVGAVTPGRAVFTSTEGGYTLTFTLTQLNSIDPTSATPGFTGAGTLTLSNGVTTFTPTTASFTLTTNAGAGTFITFHTATTPEPNSLMLLGTGLVSAAGMVVRRRRKIVA